MRAPAAAIVGEGNAGDRAVAVACAEAGARVALGTVAKTREQEYALHSIANEVWNIGPEQLVCVLDAGDAADVAAFAAQVWDRFGGCDLLVCNQDVASNAPLDELSADEWEAALRSNLTASFLAAQAFGRLMERDGGGRILLLRGEERAGDAAYRAAKAGLVELAAAITEAWGVRGVSVAVVPREGLATRAVAALGAR